MSSSVFLKIPELSRIGFHIPETMESARQAWERDDSERTTPVSEASEGRKGVADGDRMHQQPAWHLHGTCMLQPTRCPCRLGNLQLPSKGALWCAPCILRLTNTPASCKATTTGGSSDFFMWDLQDKDRQTTPSATWAAWLMIQCCVCIESIANQDRNPAKIIMTEQNAERKHCAQAWQTTRTGIEAQRRPEHQPPCPLMRTRHGTAVTCRSKKERRK